MRGACARGSTLAWRALCLPYRLYRGRLSVQLIASYLAVVFFTMVIFYVAVLASFLGYLPSFVLIGGTEEEYTLDASIGEKARTVAFWLGGDGPMREGAGLAGAEAATEILRGVIDRGAVDQAASPRAGFALDRVDLALLAAPDGTVLASTDEGWAAVGQPVAGAAFPPVGRATERAILLEGALSEYDESYVLENRDRITVGAFPVVVGQRVAGVVTLQSEPLDFSAPPIRDEVVRSVARGFVQDLPVMAVPALLISIPVGVWRARRVSRRVGRVAAAADAMARGDLDQRVDAVGTDEVGRLAERFNLMTDRLAAADRSRKAFVANVSHELRTPVAIIQGHAERLLAHPPAATVPTEPPAPPLPGPPDEPSVPPAVAVAVIHQETLTLSRLIDDLFTLARLEEAALPVEPAPVCLDEVATEAVAGLRALAWDQRKVTIRSLVSSGVPPALADRTRVRQVLNNLLHNALRHTPEGGLIIVDARALPDLRTVEVSVNDTGLGIPADKLATVFERFYRREETGRGWEGAGLGLHIVHQLVTAQGGAIHAESEAGQGTTFRFTLPLAP